MKTEILQKGRLISPSPRQIQEQKDAASLYPAQAEEWNALVAQGHASAIQNTLKRASSRESFLLHSRPDLDTLLSSLVDLRFLPYHFLLWARTDGQPICDRCEELGREKECVPQHPNEVVCKPCGQQSCSRVQISREWLTGAVLGVGRDRAKEILEWHNEKRIEKDANLADAPNMKNSQREAVHQRQSHSHSSSLSPLEESDEEKPKVTVVRRSSRTSDKAPKRTLDVDTDEDSPADIQPPTKSRRVTTLPPRIIPVPRQIAERSATEDPRPQSSSLPDAPRAAIAAERTPASAPTFSDDLALRQEDQPPKKKKKRLIKMPPRPPPAPTLNSTPIPVARSSPRPDLPKTAPASSNQSDEPSPVPVETPTSAPAPSTPAFAPLTETFITHAQCVVLVKLLEEQRHEIDALRQEIGNLKEQRKNNAREFMKLARQMDDDD